jgi:hypothetical protein
MGQMIMQEMLLGQIQVKSRNSSFDDNLGKTSKAHLGQGKKFVLEMHMFLEF